MRIVITEPRKAVIFQYLFELIGQISALISVQFNDEGVYIQAMDGSKISVIDTKLPPAWFSASGGTFEVPQAMSLGINAPQLAKILKMREAQQVLVMEAEAEDDTLHIAFLAAAAAAETGPAPEAAPKKAKRAGAAAAGPVVRAFNKEFSVPLMDVDVQLFSIPKDQEYDAEFELESVQFARLIDQLRTFGDTCGFQCSEDKIQISSTGTETGSMQVLIPIDDLSYFTINEGETISLAFCLKYMHYMTLFNKVCAKVKIHLSAGAPIRALYYLGDDETAAVDYFLAPKDVED